MVSSQRRLYIFDIDGTLIVSGGAGGSAMQAAFNALWNRDDGFGSIEFSGRTDLAIFRQALNACGLSLDPESNDLERFKRAYRRRLPGTLRSCEGRVLPGVVEVLETLSRHKDATLALGTGNFRSTAAIKLRFYGLDGFFRMGGFGDKTEDRSEMIADAIRNAQRRVGSHADVFVIGDTVHDVTAAKDNGCIAVAVATGTATAETLSDAGADIILPSLEAAAPVLMRRD